VRFFWSVLFQFLANGLAIKAADYFLAGFSFSGDLEALARTAGIITLLHVLVKPFAKIFLGPFIILSFGALAIILNAVLLWFATFWAPGLQIATYLDLALATVIFAGINFIFWLAVKFHK